MIDLNKYFCLDGKYYLKKLDVIRGKNFFYLLCFVFIVLITSCKQPQTIENTKETETQRPPNILFIVVDDLRPELGTYGKTYMKTPVIDSLASQSYQFNNAFCNIPVCGASRASIMTGIYPSLKRFYDHKARADEDVPEATTLPAHFKNNGYKTFSIGKIFHFPEDSPESWSVPFWQPDVPHMSKNYVVPQNRDRQAEPDKVGPYYEIADVPDSVYVDGMISNKAIATLDSLKTSKEPFFMAVGFLRPHLPFAVPKKYWDLYPEDEVELPDNRYWPRDAPEKRPFGFGEFKKYQYVPKEYPIPDSIVRRINHGYRASVSYVDQMIGNVLDKLKETGQADNTIIVLWGDHGFHLGEHDLFCKHVTFENTLEVPLIIKVPDSAAGKQIDALVEYVDVFPSLCELAGLEFPQDQLQGESFLPLLKSLDNSLSRKHNTKESTENYNSKKYIFSRFKTTVAVRSERYLYVMFIDDAGNYKDQMLFDHQTDPKENQNVAHLEKYQQIVNEHRTVLRQHNNSI